MPRVTTACRVVWTLSPSHSWPSAKLRRGSGSSWPFLFTKITRPATSFNLICPHYIRTFLFPFCLRLGSRAPSRVGTALLLMYKSHRRIVDYLSLHSSLLFLSLSFPIKQRRFPPPSPCSKNFKTQTASRAATIDRATTPKFGLHKASTSRNRGVSLSTQTITQIVLRYVVDSFLSFSYIITVRNLSISFPLDPLVVFETTRFPCHLFFFR